jgi:dimethylaniline monooxygenase (N-oxide forming)
MGYTLYEDTLETPQRTSSSVIVNFDKAAAEDIFHQHAQGDAIFPGTSFNNACLSLANSYPRTVLAMLKTPQMQGRAWEVLDANHDGTLALDEFITGISHLLEPKTSQMKNFVERLQQGLTTSVPGGDYSFVKRVAIVGAGVAGLQTARQLSSVGIECVIFEKSNNVGGVWRENYADFGLQVPRELYEFPGFPYPKGYTWSKFPPGPEVQKYIELYAKEFKINDMCKFETAVLALSALTGKRPGWSVKFQKKGESVKEEDFDFAVVATGMYGWPPHIPYARGHQNFKGKILHSCTFTDRKMAAGKKVVVVGGGKSAVDNAVAAAKEGMSSTLVTRTPHWPVPRYLAHLVPFQYGTYSRFGHFMLPTHHEEGNCFWWLHSACAPVKKAWWKIVETMFKCQFRLGNEHTPKERIDHDVFTGGQILTYEFRDMLKSGKCKHVISSIDCFKENSVVLVDGTEIEADLVIYGTGFKKNYDLFDASFIQPLLDIQKDGLYLYRNIIPPKVPNLAFIGSEVSTFNNIMTQGLQALWLKKMLRGEVAVPRPAGMEKIIDKEKAWKRSWMPPSSARSSIWQLHMMKYHDILVKDMGEKYKRKCSPCCEAFCPYRASDYSGLFA